MKRNLSFLVLLLLTSFGASLHAERTIPPGGILVIDQDRVPPEPSPLVRLETETQWVIEGNAVAGRISGTARVVQGRPTGFRLELSGESSVRNVTASGLKSWSETRGVEGERLLELQFTEEDGETRNSFAFEVLMGQSDLRFPATLELSLPGPGPDSAGFSGSVLLQSSALAEWEVLHTMGLRETASTGGAGFVATGLGSLTARVAASAAAPPAAVLQNVRLRGERLPDERTMRFALEADAVVREAGARLPLLGGNAAILPPFEGEGWRALLQTGGEAGGNDKQPTHLVELEFPAAGTFPVRMTFDARILLRQGIESLDFVFPGSNVVQVELAGLAGNSEFLPTAAVVVAGDGEVFQGFLPASGRCDFAWRPGTDPTLLDAGKLFVNSNAYLDMTVGPGMLEQNADFELRILQGQLEELAFALEGDGEIVAVTGTNLAGWEVMEREGARVLALRLSRPIAREGKFTIRSQTLPGEFPAKIQPLRLTPMAGETRHSGLVRIQSRGAVRFDPVELAGLMQLSPSQWTGANHENTGAQVNVYRFPSTEYALSLEARQVFPEVAVNQVLVYGLEVTDRVLRGRIELDVREAPLRDWVIEIPGDFAISSVSGTAVSDFSAGEVRDGVRPLRVVFGNPVEGRVLLQIHLEKSETAEAGLWELPELRYPEARSVRGFVGVSSAPGFRMQATEVEGLAETPLNFFPQQPAGLQLAFRQRESDWNLAVGVELLGQSVAADLFHLYSLKEGVAFGSVLMNFFVVGAPVQEWRIEVPEDAGNLVIDGQEIRSWRREGNEVVISLNRPALGPATLLATFEHPMSNRGGSLELGGITPLGVSSERGFIQVVSPLQVRSTWQPSEDLLRMESSELPVEFQFLTTAPSLAVFQYAGRPFSLGMGVEWFPQAEAVEQVVDFARLETRVSRDGQVATEAKYFVKSRGVGALRLELPKGANLWEARVNGENVSARTEGRSLSIPLPTGVDPEMAAEVELRFGSSAGFPWRMSLAAPVVDAPVLLTDWKASADTGRVLVPGFSPAVHTSQTVTQTGFAWFSNFPGMATFWVLLASVFITLFLIRAPQPGIIRKILASLSFVGVLGVCFLGMLAGQVVRLLNRSTLELIAPVAGESQPVAVTVWNLPTGMAMLSIPGLLLLLAGLALFVAGRFFSVPLPRLWMIGGWLLATTGVLLQHGGASMFFVWAGISFLLCFGPALLRLWQTGPIRPPAAALLAFCLVPLSSLSSLNAANAANDSQRVLQNLEQTIRITKDATFGEAEVSVRASAGDVFLVLRSPGVLRDFEGDGLRLARSGERGDSEGRYFVVAERDGTVRATFRYSLPTTSIPGELTLPTGPAVAGTVTMQIEESGWRFTSPQATRVEELDVRSTERSGAKLVLMPRPEQTIRIAPGARDARAEDLVFFVESSQLLVPRPGVTEGRHRFVVQVSQGMIRELFLEVPTGFMVSDVRGSIFGDSPVDWRFDPATGSLRVGLPSARQGQFEFHVDTEMPSGGLPAELELGALRVLHSGGETGVLALAFPEDAQPDSLETSGLNRINFEDFEQSLLSRPGGESPPSLYRVFRFTEPKVAMQLRVVAVQPEIRVQTAQLLSLGSERVSLSVNLTADIRRAGVFRLSFPVPEGLEVESISGESLSHWSEVREGERRVAVLHLRERTSGTQAFSLTFSGAPVEEEAEWQIPRFVLNESARAEGTLLVVPETGLRLQTLDRSNASPVDPGELGETRPGSLAFRLLQEDWRIDLGLDRLEPWITAQSVQDVQLREGQVRHQLSVRFRIEHSPIKSLLLEIPDLDETARETIRVEGDAVADFAPVEGEPEQWEIRFRRGMIGEVPLRVEFQQRTPTEKGAFTLLPASLPEARQATSFVALRSSGRLELQPQPPGEGWQRADWTAVPASLRQAGIPEVPSFTYRIGHSESPLDVRYQRQEIADALKLRISGGSFATVFSPRGDSATAAELEVLVTEKSTMSMRLPGGARLFQVSVNGEDMPVVRDGEQFLFYVMPGTDESLPSKVQFAYELPGGKSLRRKQNIQAPAFNVPLENVRWRVLVPEGWELTGHGGTMNLQATRERGLFGLDAYLDLKKDRRMKKEESANELLVQAGRYLREGDQNRARAALSQAAKTHGIDEATNEDARVQLQNLASQQAIVGLNTRRQRVLIDNRGMDDSDRSEQWNAAAQVNPLLQGRAEFDPGQMDQLLQGNTLEEASALRRMAERIVAQQLATEPAPRPVVPTIPERGTEYEFTRSVQVDGERPLSLRLEISSDRRTGAGNALLMLGGLTLLCILIPLATPRKG